MPIIRVEMFKGRTAEQKKKIARELIDGFIRGAGGGKPEVLPCRLHRRREARLGHRLRHDEREIPGQVSAMATPIRSAFSVEGEGEPLFLIHGIGASRASFAGLVPHLKRDFRVHQLRPARPWRFADAEAALHARRPRRGSGGAAPRAGHRARAFRRALAGRHDRPGLCAQVSAAREDAGPVVHRRLPHRRRQRQGEGRGGGHARQGHPAGAGGAEGPLVHAGVRGAAAGRDRAPHAAGDRHRSGCFPLRLRHLCRDRDGALAARDRRNPARC